MLRIAFLPFVFGISQSGWPCIVAGASEPFQGVYDLDDSYSYTSVSGVQTYDPQTDSWFDNGTIQPAITSPNGDWQIGLSGNSQHGYGQHRVILTRQGASNLVFGFDVVPY